MRRYTYFDWIFLLLVGLIVATSNRWNFGFWGSMALGAATVFAIYAFDNWKRRRRYAQEDQEASQ